MIYSYYWQGKNSINKRKEVNTLERRSKIILIMMLSMVVSCIFTISTLAAADVPRMTKEELKGLLSEILM